MKFWCVNFLCRRRGAYVVPCVIGLKSCFLKRPSRRKRLFFCSHCCGASIVEAGFALFYLSFSPSRHKEFIEYIYMGEKELGRRKKNLRCIFILRCYFMKKKFSIFFIGSDLLREQLEEPLKKYNIQYKRLSTVVVR